MIKKIVYLNSLVAVISLNSAFAAFVKVKDLSGELSGARIMRFLPPQTADDKRHIGELNAFFIQTFAQGYEYLFKPVFQPKGVKPSDLNKKFQDAFNESTQALDQPRSEEDFFFLEAIDSKDEKPIGTASFKKIKDTDQVYLFNFAASYFRKKEQRGVGRQLLKVIFNFLPKTDSIHLVVRKQHSKAIAIYRHWGFVDSDYVDPIYPKEDFPGMTLKGNALKHFLEK